MDFSAAMGKRHKSLTESLVEQIRNGSASFEIVSANSFTNQLPRASAPFACISAGPNAHSRDSLFFARVELPRRGTSPAMKKTEHYTVQKVRGDGRCMFRSLVKGMAANKGISLSPREEVEDADELRIAVKDALCRSDKERRVYEEALIAITVEESLKRYCQRIQHPNFWGGEPELLVLSKMCSQPIIVYIPESELCKHTIWQNQEKLHQQKGKKTIVGLNNILMSLNHQLELLDKNLGAWNNMVEIDLDILCEYEVITSVEMYHDIAHVVTNKEQILQELVKDAKATLTKITNQESMIKEVFRWLSCEIITEDNRLKNQEDVLIEFAEAICLQLEVDDFNISVLDTFASWKYSLKSLQNRIEICNKEISGVASNTQEGCNDLTTHR